MLKAILHGKAGRIEHNKNESVSWSSLFQAREDLLTSTVFERFAYLADAVQQSMLQHWFKGHYGNIPLDFGELVHISYWPRFIHEHDNGTNQVEPDLILHFEQRNIIVEVKPPNGGNQNFEQWNKEIESFLQAEDNNQRPLYFLAIGRIEPSDALHWANQLIPKFDQLKGVGFINWDAVTSQLVSLVSDEVQFDLCKQYQRIIQDILEGLSLYGQYISPFKWSELTPSIFPKLSLEHLEFSFEPKKILYQTNKLLSIQSLEFNDLGRLDLQRFHSALKEHI